MEGTRMKVRFKGWVVSKVMLICFAKKIYCHKLSPFPVFGSSVHISFTPSSTMLQCLSKAFTLPRSFLLFLQLIRTWVLFLTESVRTLSGPVENSSCSFASLSSGVMSALLVIFDQGPM